MSLCVVPQVHVHSCMAKHMEAAGTLSMTKMLSEGVLNVLPEAATW